MTATAPITGETGLPGERGDSAGGILRRTSVLRRCLVVFLLALVVRAGVGVYRHVQSGGPAALEFPDEQQYWATSRALRAGEGLRDELGFRATRMPLFPALLAMFPDGSGGLLAARALQGVFAALAAALVAGLAGVWFDRRVSWLAGLLMVFDPFLVFSSSLLLTESLFIAVTVGLWWMLARCLRDDAPSVGHWLGLGAVAAACVHARESSLGLVVVAVCFVVARHRFRRSTLTGAAITVMLVVASLIPWAVRNERITGSWVWLTTRAGISLYDGVRPGATGASDLGDVKNMPAVRGLSETQWNRYFLDASHAAIVDDPVRIVRLGGVKFMRMWNPFPNVDTYQSSLVRAISAGWAFPTFALAAVGAVYLPIRHRQVGLRIAMFLCLPAVYLTALHCVFVGSVRYRLGAVPMLHILAAFGLVAVWDWRRTEPQASACAESARDEALGSADGRAISE